MDEIVTVLPAWAAALMMVLLVSGSVAVGLALGRRHRRLRPEDDPGPSRAAAGATLGLLAFLLAFTFGMAYSRMDQRKMLVLEESNVIGTAWLRTDLLDDSGGAEARRLLSEYVAVRTSITADTLAQALATSEQLQDRLWKIAVAGVAADPAARLFLQSVNNLIDMHVKRVTFGLQYRTPAPIWLAFSFVTMMAMISLGYMFGMAGTFQASVTVTLALAFTAMILLIGDIDRPGQGLMRTDIRPLLDLQQRLNP